MQKSTKYASIFEADRKKQKITGTQAMPQAGMQAAIEATKATAQEQ